MMQGFIEIGKITAAHGLKGQVKIHSYTENPLDIKDYALFDAKKQPYQIMKASMAGRAVLVTLNAVTDRNQAEALKGITLYIQQDALSAQEGEVYHKDIIGQPVLNRENKDLGKITGIFNFGAGDVVEIKLLSNKEVMIPLEECSFEEENIIINETSLESFM